MQQRSFLVALALLASSAAATLSAQDAARLFLRRHAGTPPQGDELAELKGSNPEAYALVKALLTKRSLGLLDPRHPTASFAHGSEQQQPASQGPEVFDQFASPAGSMSLAKVQQHKSQVALPYAQVGQASHQDWMNWKPQESGMSDEQMVSNVLGAVAELKGKKAGLLSKARNTDSALDTLAGDEASFGVAAEPAKPKAENSYLKNIDLGGEAPIKPAAAAAPHKNSYLDGIDLSGEMPRATAAAAQSKKPAQVQQSSTNYLASFSWDDSKPAERPKPKALRHTDPKVSGSKDGSLMSWLGVVHDAPAPKAPAAQPEKPSNPYLTDLS